MDTTLERLDEHRVRLTVTVPAADVDRHVAAAYESVAAKVKVPGFRKGKVPPQVIDTHGAKPSVLGEALEELVTEALPEALEAEAIRPMDRPDTGDLPMPVEGEDYTFAFEVTSRPQLTLSSIEGLTAKVPSSATTDREVDAQIEHLRDRYATLEPVEGRGVQADDFVLLSFKGTIDGEGYEGDVVDKFLYESGRGTMPSEFDEGLVGAKPGDELHIEFTVPETSSNPEFVGKVAGFDVTVHEIKSKKLPELDGAFANEVGGFDTFEELRADTRERLESAKSVGRVQLTERAVRAVLAARLEGDIPSFMVDDKAAAMFEQFFETLKERDLTLDDYVAATGVEPDQIERDIRDEAVKAIADELALEALFRKAELEVPDEEVDAQLDLMAESNEADPAQFKENLRRAGMMFLVREQLEHRRAVRWLMDNVEVVDAEPAESDSAPDASETAPDTEE